MPRLFVAIPLPEPAKSALALLNVRMHGARWVKPAQMHLTLRFLGEIAEPDYQALTGALEGVVAAPFELRLKGVGFFPPNGVPRVLWAGFETCTPLIALQKQIEAAARSAGVAPEKKPYTPHQTLARLERTPPHEAGEFIAANALFSAPPFQAEEFHLYSSKLHPSGAVHSLEAVYPLRS